LIGEVGWELVRDFFSTKSEAGGDPHAGDVADVVSSAPEGDGGDLHIADIGDGLEPILDVIIDAGEGIGGVGIGAHLEDDGLGIEVFYQGH
jgi:hypothetical protein